MPNKKTHYVNRGRRKSSALVPALVILCVAFIAASVGAFAWHKMSGNDDGYDSQKQMLFPSKPSSAPPPSEPAPSKQESAPTSESSVSDASAASQSAPDQSAASGSAPQTADSPVVVPEGERVASTYFDDALFVGDSITDGIRAYELMQNTTVISHTGINPDSIRNKAVFRNKAGADVTCLQAMAEYPNAKKIYLMMGANSAAWMSQEVFIECYEEFVGSVVEQHPEATIYIQSITPLNEGLFKVKYSGQDLDNAKIQAYNNELIKLAERLGVHYVNVWEALTGSDGQLPEEATTDGMHFGTQYYQKWFDYLKTHAIP